MAELVELFIAMLEKLIEASDRSASRSGDKLLVGVVIESLVAVVAVLQVAVV